MSSPAKPATTAFRPRRSTGSRASLPNVSHAGIGPQHRVEQSLNIPITTQDNSKRKKRSQSLGGAELQQLKKQRTASNENMTEILQPVHKRTAAPRRSILKQTAAFDAHTTDLSNLSTFVAKPAEAVFATVDNNDDDAPDDDEEDADTDSDMDMTMLTMDQDRRKSLARRVSFAPNTFVRTFTPDKPTAIVQAAVAAAAASAQHGEPVSPGSSVADDSMDMATTEVTSAFAGHFAGTNVVVDPNVSYDDSEDEDRAHAQEGDSSIEEEQSMELVTGDITAAFAAQQTSVVNSKQRAPRFSEIVRAEDEEDREIRMALGLPSPKSKAFKGFKAVQVDPATTQTEEEDEDEDEEMADMEDGTATMEMTTALGSTQAADGAADMSLLSPKRAPVEDAGIPTPSTPSARLRASLQVSRTPERTAPSPRPALPSPRRLSTAPSPLKSSVLKSPARISLQTALKSPFKSPAASRVPNASVISFTNPRSANSTPRALASAEQRDPTLAAQGSPNISLSRRSPRKSLSPKKQQMRASLGRQNPSSPMSAQNAAGGESFIDEGDSLLSSITLDGQDGHAAVPTAMTLQDFFDNTNVGFISDVLSMTGIKVGQQSKTGTASLSRRRSVAASAAKNGSTEPPSFADLVVAGACKSPFYELYQNDQGRLQDDIQASLGSLKEVEKVLKYEQPAIFAQWQRASEPQKANLRSMFRMIKTYYFNLGRADWNEYRAANYDRIISFMELNLEGLKEDQRIVEETNLDEQIAALRERRDALARELEEEQRRDRELTTCDQEELSELHAAIVEQAEQLNIQEKQIADVEQQLTPLQAKMEELELQRAKLDAERDGLVSRLEGRAVTRSEAVRLQHDFEALQDLHGWSLKTFSSQAILLRHMDEFDLEIMISQGKVKSASLALCELPPAPVGSSQHARNAFTSFFFEHLASHAQQMVAIKPAVLVQEVASLWTAARRIRREFGLVAMRYPSDTSISPDSGSLMMRSSVHVLSSRAAFDIVFELTGDEIFDDARHAVDPDLVLEHVAVDASSRWGNIDVKSIVYMLRENLDNGGREAVIDACRQAESLIEAQ